MVLQRCQTSEGIVYYASPLLLRIGVPHAFSTRIGGESPPPFDSMNLGNPSNCDVQDDPQRIAVNYAKLLRAIGCDAAAPLMVHQVHGSEIAQVAAGQTWKTGVCADAIISVDPAHPISVRIADCVPILLASADGHCVAAVHAGWRGVIGGIAYAAVRQLAKTAACEPDQLFAAIGPCISRTAFEVGGEVLVQFREKFGADVIDTDAGGGKGHVDLRAALRKQLTGAGLRVESIDDTDRCTVRDGDEFFSHRRDNGRTGRMAAIIAPVAAGSSTVSLA